MSLVEWLVHITKKVLPVRKPNYFLCIYNSNMLFFSKLIDFKIPVVTPDMLFKVMLCSPNALLGFILFPQCYFLHCQ